MAFVPQDAEGVFGDSQDSREICGGVVPGAPRCDEKDQDFIQGNGICADRVFFGPYITPKSQHLSRIEALAGIYLDPMMYNGHTTANDSMWSGSPFVCAVGRDVATRVCAGMAYHTNLPDLIVNTEDDYIKLAVRLGQDKRFFDDCRGRVFHARVYSTVFSNLYPICFADGLHNLWDSFLGGNGSYSKDIKVRTNRDSWKVDEDLERALQA